jgi:hypothetical protein
LEPWTISQVLIRDTFYNERCELTVTCPCCWHNR